MSLPKDVSEDMSRTMLGNAAAAGESYKGLQAIGQGIQKAGEGAIAFGIEQKRADEYLFSAKSNASITAKALELGDILERETDPEKIKSQIAPQFDATIQSIAASIEDPYQRDLFLARSQDNLARFKVAVDTRLRKIQDTESNANDQLLSEQLHNQFVVAKTPEDEKRAIDALRTLLDARVKSGRMMPGEDKTYLDKWVKEGVVGKFEAMPAQEAVAALGGVRGALMTRESGGRPGLVNQFGFAGLYQFGAPRLKELGVYVPGPDEALNGRDDVRNWNRSAKDAPGKWSGSFNIPGFPEVKTLNDFLRNRGAQEAAMDMHLAKMDQEIDRAGLGKYVGTTVAGVPITRDGIKAMMHLGGIGGAKAALQGESVASDANGTSVLEYAKMGSLAHKYTEVIPAEKAKEIYDRKVGEFIVGTREQQLAEREAEKQKKDAAEQAQNDYSRRLLDGNLSNIFVDIHNDPRLDDAQKLQLTNLVERETGSTKSEDKTYGSGYKQAVDDIVNRRVTDFSEILKLANDGKLTVQGVHALGGYLTGMRKDTSSAGITTTKARVLDQAKKYLSFEDPNGYIKDPDGERIFNLQFVRRFESEFDKWVAAGKDPYEFLDEKNVRPMYESLRNQEDINKARLSATSAAIGESQAAANPSSDIALPPPSSVKKEVWQKTIMDRPSLSDGKPEAVFAWTKALSTLVANRDNPLVRKAFTKRYPGKNADDILLQLGF